MVTNKKTYGKAKSIPVGLAWGAVVAVCITMCFAVAITQLVMEERISENAIGYGTMITLPLASVSSSLVSIGLIKRRRMQVCMMSGGIYIGVLLLVNLLLFGGQFGGLGVSVLLILFGVRNLFLLGN